MQTQKKGLDFKGQNIFVGIDVHLKSWAVTILTDNLVWFTRPIQGKAQQYIQENKSKPFFLSYALHQPHVPSTPNQRFVGASGMVPRGGHH